MSLLLQGREAVVPPEEVAVLLAERCQQLRLEISQARAAYQLVVGWHSFHRPAGDGSQADR